MSSFNEELQCQAVLQCLSALGNLLEAYGVDDSAEELISLAKEEGFSFNCCANSPNKTAKLSSYVILKSMVSKLDKIVDEYREN